MYSEIAWDRVVILVVVVAIIFGLGFYAGCAFS